MPQPIYCDLCTEVPADFLVTRLDGGQVQAVCVLDFIAVGKGLEALLEEVPAGEGAPEGAPEELDGGGAMEIAATELDGAPKSAAEGDTETPATEAEAPDEVPAAADG